MRSKRVVEYQHKAKSRDYLIALTDNPGYCRLLQQKGKPYQRLLEWIIEYGEIPESDDKLFPEMKKVSEVIGVEYSKVAKQLKQIYDDIYSLNDTNPSLFVNEGQRSYEVFFEYHGSYGFFNIGLNHAPRSGERFIFPFIKPKVGSDYFWIRDVQNQINNGKHTLYIRLASEEPNLYRQLLKEKAYLNRQLSWDEYHGVMSYATEERLLKWFRNL